MQELLKSLLQVVLLSLNPVIVIPVMIIIIVLVKKDKDYKKSAYYQITKLPYKSVKYDKGRRGEYIIYKRLKQYETSGAKFLFNIYMPKENGETTEIDVLMICKKGLFVFESKYFKGWIFGSEDQKNWYQTLPSGRNRSHKEHFYNPIMQNRSHIKHLKVLLGELIPMRSIIVFSDKCTLKSVQVNSDDIRVINGYNVATTVSCIFEQNQSDVLSDNKIIKIYNKLYPYTQVDEITKTQHITTIQNRLKPEPVPRIAMPSQVIPQPQAEPITEQTAMMHCPKCNGSLILRTATKGAYAGKQFYGCSNYPQCKYIQNLSK